MSCIEVAGFLGRREDEVRDKTRKLGANLPEPPPARPPRRRTSEPRFRTIQFCPTDLPAISRQPEPAVSWHSGFRRGAHAAVLPATAVAERLVIGCHVL